MVTRAKSIPFINIQTIKLIYEERSFSEHTRYSYVYLIYPKEKLYIRIYILVDAKLKFPLHIIILKPVIISYNIKAPSYATAAVAARYNR